MAQDTNQRCEDPTQVHPKHGRPLQKENHLVLRVITRQSLPLDHAEVKSIYYRLLIGNTRVVTDADRGSSFRNLFKILAVVFFIAFIIAVVLLALIYPKYNQLKDKHSQLELNDNTLQADYNQLGQERNSLQVNYSHLQHSYNSLQANYGQLEHRYNRLQASCSQLEERHSSLQANYSQIEHRYQGLQANCRQLEEGHNDLQANYSQLEEGYNDLQANYSQLEEGHNNLQANYSQLEEGHNNLGKRYNQLSFRTRELLNSLVGDDINSTCPQGWVKFNKTCYYFSTEESNWDGANSSCTAHNSTLAIVTTQSQQDFITKQDLVRRWIGLTDLGRTGVFKWVNGERLEKGFWARGEPNNQGVERCVTKGAQFHPHKWNNDDCSEKHCWICQISLSEYLARRFGLEALLRQ